MSIDHSDPDPSDPDLSEPDVVAWAEAAQLARRLPAVLLRDSLELLVELVERPGSGSLKIEKAANGKVFMRGHGNEFGSSTYDLVRDSEC